MSNSELERIVKEAKERLKNGYWDGVKEEKRATAERAEMQGADPKSAVERIVKKVKQNIFCGEKSVKQAETEYKIVCSILDAEEDGTVVFSPLKHLYPEDYSVASPEAKERIVLQTSEKFAKHKKRYYQEKEERATLKA